MNYKVVLLGVAFYIVITGIEKASNLKTFSLLIPALAVVVGVSMFIKHKKK